MLLSGTRSGGQTRCMKHDQNRPMYFQFHKSDQPKVRHCDTWIAKISLQNRWNELVSIDSGLMTIRHSAEISGVYIYGFLDSITSGFHGSAALQRHVPANSVANCPA